MALSQTLSIDVGSRSVAFDGAYARVSEYHGTKSRISFVVTWSEAAGTAMLRQDTYVCDLNIDGDNPIRQAYLHLKTLPEFANAVDC